MSQANARYTLPGPIAQKLRAVQRRMNRVGLVTAAVGAIAVLLAAMLVAMLVDYLATLYDSAWRPALTYSAMCLALATLAGWVVLAWRRSRRTVDIAREVDRRVPHLEERWSTIAYFSGSPAAGDGAVHPAMFRHVADEAVRGEAYVDPGRVVPLSGVVRAFLVLNAVTLVLVLAAVADWRQTSVLFRRFWAPGANISVTGFQAEPGDAVVGRGEPLLISASLTGPPIGEATLMLHSDAEGDDRITLVPRGARVPSGEGELSVTHRFRSVEDSFAYRLRGGDGQTEWFDVTVADRPILRAVRLEVTPPDYRKESAQRLDKLPRRLAAVDGSELALALQPAAPLRSLRLETGDGEPAELTLGEDGWYRWRVELTKDLTLTPLLTEPHGLAMRRPPTTRLQVYPDRPPVVRVISPDDHIAVTPDDTIEIDFVAEDDNGIGSAELVVLQDPLDGESAPIVLETIPIDLGDAVGDKQVRGRVELDLSSYPLVDGSSLNYAVRVVEQRSPQTPSETVAGANGGDAQEKPMASEEPDPAAVAKAPGDPPQERGPGSAPEAPTRVASANEPVGQSLGETPKTVATADLGEQSNQPSLDHPSADDAPPKFLEPNLGSKPAASGLAAAPAGDRQTDQDAAGPAANSLPAEDSARVATASGEPANPGETESDRAGATAMNPTQKTNPARPSAEQPTGSGPADDQPGESSLAGAETEQDGRAPSPPDKEEAPASRTAESDKRSIVAATPSDPVQSDQLEDQPAAGSMASSSNASQASSDQQAGENELRPAADALAASGNGNAGDKPSRPGGKPRSATSTPQSSRVASASQDAASNPSEQPPGDSMTRRGLDVGAQTATSNAMRLEVDQYAGSFQGQQRAKLEIAIAPELEAIRQHLLRAQKLSRSTLDGLAAGEGWQARRHRDIGAAEQTLKQAQEISHKLQGRTHNTPYAFIGLQIADISAANITPARDDFWKSLQSEGEDRTEKIRRGWRQVGQALDRIAALSQKFEVTRREYALAETVQKLEKMYRVFIEDSFAGPLGGGDDGGSPFQRKIAEFDLDEEYLERLREVLEMRRDLRAELARLLAEDPRLLRRFMNNFREGQLNLRNQLTELAGRQRRLAEEVDYWAVVDDAKREAAMRMVTRRRLAESAGFATKVGEMVDRFEAWMPLDVKKEELGAALDEADALAADARELALMAQRLGSTRPEGGQLGALVESSDAVYSRLREFEVTLRGLGADESLAGDIDFVINRLADTRGLITAASSWNRRIEGLAGGSFHRAAAIEQYELATATDELAGKLAGVEAEIAGLLQSRGTLPASIAEPARALLKTLDQQVTPNQMASANALGRESWARAAERQRAATDALAKAEGSFDELIKAAIEELDKLPVQDPIAQLLDDPTLDELLAELERETRLEEALGIPLRPSNLRIIGDWLRPGAAGGMGGGMGMLARQSQGQQRRLAQAARRAQEQAMRRIQKNRAVNRQAPPQPGEEETNQSDWNKLVSELDDELLQGRDKLPPERYRTAIEQYRTLINRIASQRGEEP